MQLRLDLTVRRLRFEQRLDRIDQVERLGVEDHQLLLDSNRELMPLEVVLHCEEANDDRASLGGRAWVPSTAAPETAKEFTHGKRYRVEGRSHLRAAWRPSGRPVGPSVPHDRR